MIFRDWGSTLIDWDLRGVETKGMIVDPEVEFAIRTSQRLVCGDLAHSVYSRVRAELKGSGAGALYLIGRDTGDAGPESCKRCHPPDRNLGLTVRLLRTCQSRAVESLSCSFSKRYTDLYYALEDYLSASRLIAKVDVRSGL